jgi:hypothetical protein
MTRCILHTYFSKLSYDWNCNIPCLEMCGVQLGIRLIGDSFHKHPSVSETQCDTPEFAVFRNVEKCSC